MNMATQCQAIGILKKAGRMIESANAYQENAAQRYLDLAIKRTRSVGVDRQLAAIHAGIRAQREGMKVYT